MIDHAAPPSVLPFWQIELRPHRSLPPGGFRLLMLIACLISILCGTGFALIGAWPVGGFFGLDMLLLYLAFRASYRSGRMRETVSLDGGDLTIERVSVRGELRFWRMQAFWLKVRLIESGDDSNRLLLSTHGRTLAIGGFLSPLERRGLARELEAALRRWRAQAP
jgi:uncharacterized membrane protein